MRFNTHIIAAGAAALALTTGACSPNWKVKRIDPEKTVDLDLQYIDTWSIWADTLILFRTVKAVLSANGAT